MISKTARAMQGLGLVALTVLAACQPQDPGAARAPEPAAEPARAVTVTDFSQPITALGTEPFWSLKIDGARFTLTRPDHKDLVAEAPGAMIEPGRGFWIARGPEGAQLSVTLTVSPCSDGMSDRAYPMSAEVVLMNETLVGCAIKTAEMPTARP